MKFAKELKCMYYLFKCSKYLYFIKKILCAVTVAVMVITALSLLTDNKALKKGIRGLMP